MFSTWKNGQNNDIVFIYLSFTALLNFFTFIGYISEKYVNDLYWRWINYSYGKSELMHHVQILSWDNWYLFCTNRLGKSRNPSLLILGKLASLTMASSWSQRETTLISKQGKRQWEIVFPNATFRHIKEKKPISWKDIWLSGMRLNWLKLDLITLESKNKNQLTLTLLNNMYTLFYHLPYQILLYILQNIYILHYYPWERQESTFPHTK